MKIDFPVEIKGLRIDHNNFEYKGKSYNYNEIISLSFQHRIDAINGINTNNSSTFMLKLKDDSVISITAHTGILNQKNKQLMPAIYKFLNDITFNNIVTRYLNAFSENGYIDYEFKQDIGALGPIGFSKTARIYPDGNIKVGDKVVNLKKARTHGILEFGTEYGISISGHTRPREIAMSEAKGFLWTRLLKINAQWDTSIIFSIIKGLSEGKQFLTML